MTTLLAQAENPAPTNGRAVRVPRPTVTLVAGALAAVCLVLALGSVPGWLVIAGVVALALGLCALGSPVAATILLLVVMFLRIPIKAMAALPVELFLAVFGALVVATVLWLDRTPERLRGVGAIGWTMALFVAWNFYSMVAPHEYPAVDVLLAEVLSVPRLIVIGTLIPFAMFVIGRYAFDRTSAVRALLWTILALAAYSAAVSIMPFTGLGAFVWPHYIVVVERPGWAGRAVGIFNQPVVNGMVLALGIAIAMLIISRRTEPTWQRCIAFVIAVGAGAGLYETHTRAAWMGGVAVLVIGTLLAKGSRQWYASVLVLLLAFVAANWATFTSDDRAAGGVGSQGEVESRLNDIQTALWAFTRKPLEGWGVGRFQSVNSYHHQQWAPDTTWSLGLGEVSHQNELAILAELGLIGLALWICVLALIAVRLARAYRTLPEHDLCGKPLAVLSIMGMAILVCAGMTVDLRYFEFAITIILMLVGITVGWADRGELAKAAQHG
jgi:O-antigen ligase